jgi:hypothetical protein
MGGLVKRFLEKASGQWLTADRVQAGDRVLIRKLSVDETSFERPYLIVDGVLRRTGEEVRVRLGSRAVQRVAEVLGSDEAGWVGHELEVVGIESYPGLAKKRGVAEAKGILWKGVKAQAPAGLSEAVLQGFLRAHVEQIGGDVPGLASNVEPDVLAEAERRGLVELLEVKGRRMYLLTEEGRRLAEAG